jgi:hypothetical protein
VRRLGASDCVSYDNLDAGSTRIGLPATAEEAPTSALLRPVFVCSSFDSDFKIRAYPLAMLANGTEATSVEIRHSAQLSWASCVELALQGEEV